MSELLAGPEKGELDAVAATCRHVGHALGNALAGLSLSLELLETCVEPEARARTLARCQAVCARLVDQHGHLVALGSGVLRDEGAHDVAQLLLGALHDAGLERMPHTLKAAPSCACVWGQASLLREALASLLRVVSDAAGEAASLLLRADPCADGVALRLCAVAGPPGGSLSGPSAHAPAPWSLEASVRAGTQAAVLYARAIVERLHGGRIALTNVAACLQVDVLLPAAAPTEPP